MVATKAATGGVKKGVLKNFANFTKKASMLESLFNKITGLQTCYFIKKETPAQIYFVKFVKLLRKSILENTC